MCLSMIGFAFRNMKWALCSAALLALACKKSKQSVLVDKLRHSSEPKNCVLSLSETTLGGAQW